MPNSPYFDAARRLGAADFGTVASAGLPTSRYVLPQFEERTAYGFKRQDPYAKLFEDRIVALLYKQTVEMDMAMSILLQSLNVSEEVLRQERAKSIAAVKRTNGQLRLEQKLRELESEAWQC